MKEDGGMIRKMVRGLRNVGMGLFTLASSKKESLMVRVDISGLRGMFMRAPGGMEKDMGMGFGGQSVMRSMKVTGVSENLRVLAFITILMALLMRENSKMR